MPEFEYNKFYLHGSMLIYTRRDDQHLVLDAEVGSFQEAADLVEAISPGDWVHINLPVRRPKRKKVRKF
jgi:hypothetical protein